MKKLKLLFLRPFNEKSRNEIFNSLNEFYEFIYPESFKENIILKYAPLAEVALGNKVSDQFLYNAKKLKLLQTPSSGVEELNTKLIRELGIQVANSCSHAPFVAEHAIALALGMLKKISYHNKVLEHKKNNNFSLNENKFDTDTLIGKSIGFIGFGNINNAIYNFLKPFKNEFYFFCRNSKNKDQIISIHEIFRKSDLIFVALPLTESTKNIINIEHFQVKNPCPYIVNIGRAETINKNDLLYVLKNNLIKGFASDVPYGGKII